MKKILGISLVALVVSAPAFAARDSGLIGSTVAQSGSNDGSYVATTGYVKGAYNVNANQINLLVADTAVGTSKRCIVAGDSVAENLANLDDCIQDATAQEASVTPTTGSITTCSSWGSENCNQPTTFITGVDVTLVPATQPEPGTPEP